MIKFIIIFVVIALFASQNFETVQVRLIFGPAIQMPLIFAILLGFLMGYLYSLIRSKLKYHRKLKELENEEF